MKITTFEPQEYRGCKIYYRNFLTHFEYFIIINKELYTAHITIKPLPISRLLYWLEFSNLLYSKKTIAGTLGYLRKMAETTIDSVLDKGKGKQAQKPKQKRKKKKKKK